MAQRHLGRARAAGLVPLTRSTLLVTMVLAGAIFAPDVGAADATTYIGVDATGVGYVIDVPPGGINRFFTPRDFPTLASAHRGGFKPGFPENAIETFAETLRWSPALMEVDVRRTRDGVWILMHDETLDRTTTGMGAVAERTWHEIHELRLVDQTGAITPFGIPTLVRALRWAQGRTILELDLKVDERTAEVVALVTQDMRKMSCALSQMMLRKQIVCTG